VAGGDEGSQGERAIAKDRVGDSGPCWDTSEAQQHQSIENPIYEEPEIGWQGIAEQLPALHLQVTHH
jgi:hypothetical protein